MVHVHQMQTKKHSLQPHNKLNLHNQTDMILQNHLVTLSSITQQTNVASCCTNTTVQLFYCYTLYVQGIRIKIMAAGLVERQDMFVSLCFMRLYLHFWQKQEHHP